MSTDLAKDQLTTKINFNLREIGQQLPTMVGRVRLSALKELRCLLKTCMNLAK